MILSKGIYIMNQNDNSFNNPLNNTTAKHNMFKDLLDKHPFASGVAASIIATVICTSANNIILFKNIPTRLDNIEGQMTSIEGQMTEMQEQVTEIQEQVTKVKTDIAVLDNRVSNIETSIENLDSRIRDIETGKVANRYYTV